jgi:hypothetical protein
MRGGFMRAWGWGRAGRFFLVAETNTTVIARLLTIRPVFQRRLRRTRSRGVLDRPVKCRATTILIVQPPLPEPQFPEEAIGYS